MILEKNLALLLKGGLHEARENTEHPRKQNLEVHRRVEDVDGRIYRFTHRCDLKGELIADPGRLHLSASRDMLLQLVNIVGDPAPRLVLAKIVGKIDVDGLSHICDVGGCSALFKLGWPAMTCMMRALAPLLLLVAGPVETQTAPAPAVQPAAIPVAAWDPAAPYITQGQDEPGYRQWYLGDPSRAGAVKAFNDYLVSNQVGGVLPTWQLLRTATAWKDCGSQPFEVPPPDQWQHMVETLRYIRDYVIPAVGPVEPVSAYRNPTLNVCAGGAPESAHRLDSAVDLVPLKPITREVLMRTLCGVHTEHGAAYNAGLGFYAYLRFHVDSTKFRRWNMDPAVAADCPPILHPDDAASSGQPLPPTSPAPQQPTPAATAAVAPAAAAPLPATTVPSNPAPVPPR